MMVFIMFMFIGLIIYVINLEDKNSELKKEIKEKENENK